MHVVFDAYWWVEGPLSNQTVQRELITTWLRQHPDDDAVLVVPDAHVDAVQADVAGLARAVGTRVRPHGAAVTLAIPRIRRRLGADAVVAHNFTPLGGCSVTFVHDVLFQTNPEWFTVPERLYLAPIPRLARRARAVLTSTRHEAQRIERRNPRLGPVGAIGLAVSSTLAEATPHRPDGLPAVAGFVLTVGRLNVRKNLERTIDAALDSGAVAADHPLVVVGEPAGRAAPLGARAAAARADGAVVFLDRVDDAGLSWLYRHTELFCCLSLDEGFGLPPVEAAHFGARVLCSDIPVFAETMTGRATFVDPLDTAAIATALRTLLAAPEPRTTPTDPFSWTDTVARLRETVVRVVADTTSSTGCAGRASIPPDEL